jgi:lysozyme family protein
MPSKAMKDLGLGMGRSDLYFMDGGSFKGSAAWDLARRMWKGETYTVITSKLRGVFAPWHKMCTLKAQVSL